MEEYKTRDKFTFHSELWNREAFQSIEYFYKNYTYNQIKVHYAFYSNDPNSYIFKIFFPPISPSKEHQKDLLMMQWKQEF